MTTTPEATKGVPRIEGDTALTPRADHNAHADWDRDNVNTRVANTTARDAIVNKYAGLIVQTADTNTLWMCTAPAAAGTWVAIPEDTGWFDVGTGGSTFVSAAWTALPDFVASYGTLAYRRYGKTVHLRGWVKKNATINASDAAFILPARFRPTSGREVMVRQSTGMQAGIIDSSGVFRFISGGGTEAVMQGSWLVD